MEYRDTTINTYDGRNRLLKQTVETDWAPSDGIPGEVGSTTNTYDQQGNLLTQVRAQDGLVWQTISNSYDQRGNLLITWDNGIVLGVAHLDDQQLRPPGRLLSQ